MGNKLSIGIHYGCTFQTQQWLVVGWLSKINNHELLYYCLFWGGIATLAYTYIFNIFHRKLFELGKKIKISLMRIPDFSLEIWD